MDQAGFGLSGKHARLIFNIPDLEHVFADVELTAFQTYIDGRGHRGQVHTWPTFTVVSIETEKI